MATSKARAYYALVSRLKKAELPFLSVTADSECEWCDVVLTTAEEALPFGGKALVLEGLDENAGVFKGQVLAKLDGGGDVVLVGIDPGNRIGLAVFYGGAKLAFSTFHSVSSVCSRVAKFSDGVPNSNVVVRIGNGDMRMVASLSETLRRSLPYATIEIVDEAGTSRRTAKMKGLQGDERAAAKIAFRKGTVIGSAEPRIRE